jgi:hypothetical protein
MRRPEFGEEVAAQDFIFLGSDGDRREVKIRIGKPYEVSAIEWACPSEILGYEPRYPDAHGGSSLQAICLAVLLLRSRVEDFMSKGGRVLGLEDNLEWDSKGIAATFGASGANAA